MPFLQDRLGFDRMSALGHVDAISAPMAPYCRASTSNGPTADIKRGLYNGYCLSRGLRLVIRLVDLMLRRRLPCGS
jgi:hypothetical protein